MVVLYISDVAYSDGKTGDYLFLGNFVYTVSIVIFFKVCYSSIYMISDGFKT